MYKPLFLNHPKIFPGVAKPNRKCARGKKSVRFLRAIQLPYCAILTNSIIPGSELFLREKCHYLLRPNYILAREVDALFMTITISVR